jgi:HlyD family secretion protein
MKNYLILFIFVSIWTSCGNNDELSDAYGNFEAKDIIVSAETAGLVTDFSAKEGDLLKSGEKIGLIDTLQIYLQIMQIEAQKSATATQFNTLESQIKVQKVQIDNLNTEIARLKKLVEEGAAPQQKLDNLEQQKMVIEQNIESINTQKNSISAQLNVAEAQKEVLENQLRKCYLTNPLSGTVLKVYIRIGELAAPGKALYRLANLDEMDLKVFVSGAQLAQIKIGETAEVLIDAPENTTESLEGKIIWVSEQAEFTPKIIQTREERVNMVYAVKIAVKNNGRLKIGMPAEVNFNTLQSKNE